MANDSISPVSRASTFQRPTPSAATPQTRVLDTSAPAINAQPVELDGMPTTPEELRRRGTAGSTGVGCSSGPADGEDIDAEFLGEGGKGAGQIGREVCLFYRLFLPPVDSGWEMEVGRTDSGYRSVLRFWRRVRETPASLSMCRVSLRRRRLRRPRVVMG
jgi:hypothetical protein